MKSFKIILEQDGQKFETLSDILPNPSRSLDILFIGKTPTTKSVHVGHYFQGRHGQMFWNKLKFFGLLKVRPGSYEDENLLDHNFGLTDVAKKPRDFGDEPSELEYRAGLKRILRLVTKHRPKIIVFVYKRVLDNVLKWGFGLNIKSVYGFNQELNRYFDSEVFVFPMPGTPCTTDEAIRAMNELTTRTDRKPLPRS